MILVDRKSTSGFNCFSVGKGVISRVICGRRLFQGDTGFALGMGTRDHVKAVGIRGASFGAFEECSLSCELHETNDPISATDG